ncbi:isopentenyl-diphosphate Delta-isomerase [Pedobacter frigiditerrae]|uniref:Isopentenyl-diphosphate delta-isomerase n=1 Tax=Pedobacter frigiditerrae TaxID=2530452 RepID=A0A4R0MQL0_9SPHI|nr:isopentenyl-diphosphate Delta-isomerase [Pedobacter frigiditerrae]TCC89171.1 isopentenyl-diphosphate Delta-isomerase [Pedobacter frigiditerrae]
MAENVILVDKYDNEIGLMPKMQAHIEGELHRAFSIFIFNSKGQLLLQQRAFGKYHSGGKWTNTCCSHPRLGESNLAAAHRRLKEEMGMSCELSYGFNFIYKASVNEGILEHEFDHVYFGISDDLPEINTEEVSDYKYLAIEDLAQDLSHKPDSYTEWLKICFNKVIEFYPQIYK